MLKNCKDKIAIWGAGLNGKKFYLQYRKKYNIVCFYDNNEKLWHTSYEGKEIRKYSIDDKVKIIIAVDNWKAIAAYLESVGLRAFKDYLPYSLVGSVELDGSALLYLLKGKNDFDISYLKNGRKIAVIFGNCQTVMLRKYLQLYNEFSDKYIFLVLPAICVMSKDEIEVLIHSDKIFKLIDLLIIQDISVSNKFSKYLSSQYLISRCESICKVIRIINIYFDGYFIQYQSNNKNSKGQELHQAGNLPITDIFIDDLMRQNYDEETIVSAILDKQFVNKELVEKAVLESFRRLREYENRSDIIISDYLSENYRERQLFYAPNHPYNEVLAEYGKRILCYLGITASEVSLSDYHNWAGSLKGVDALIYPSVIKALSLKEYEKKYYINRYMYPNNIYNNKEYIVEYINRSQ